MLSRSVYRESMTACTRVKPDKMPAPRMGIGHKVPALTKRLFAIDAKGKGYQFSSAACLWLYQPHSRTGHMLSSRWPTQNGHDAFVFCCFVDFLINFVFSALLTLLIFIFSLFCSLFLLFIFPVFLLRVWYVREATWSRVGGEVVGNLRKLVGKI